MAGPDARCVAHELRGRVAVVVLNRPEQRNALSRELIAQLHALILELNTNEAVRAIVLTGSGSAFCAGLDLAELETLLDQDAAQHEADTRALTALYLAIMSAAKPVIAAVNGPAVAGGAGLVNAADLAVMARSARLGYTEARIGFVAAIVGVLLARQLGDKQARDLLLSARLLTADEALGYGLVNAVVEDDQVLNEACRLAELLAHNAPGSLSLSKRLLLETAGLPLADALDRAVSLNVEARLGQELASGARAFLERRPLPWQAPANAEEREHS